MKIWTKIKFENILKKGSLMHAAIACMKQLEYALLWRIFQLNHKQVHILDIVLIIISGFLFEITVDADNCVQWLIIWSMIFPG